MGKGGRGEHTLASGKLKEEQLACSLARTCDGPKLAWFLDFRCRHKLNLPTRERIRNK